MCASIITDQHDRLSWTRSFTGIIQVNEYRQVYSTIAIFSNILENFTILMKYAHTDNKPIRSGKNSLKISCREVHGKAGRACLLLLIPTQSNKFHCHHRHTQP